MICFAKDNWAGYENKEPDGYDVVFVGGPADGEVRRVKELHRIYEVCVRSKPWITFDDLPSDRVPANDMFHKTAYRLERFRGEKKDFCFYVEYDMPIDEAMSMLIAGYRQPKEQEARR